MAEQTAGFEQFERDLDNFRLVLKSLTRIGNHGEALRLAAALTPFWMARGQMLVSGWRTRGGRGRLRCSSSRPDPLLGE
jgi:hypothetical protein